MVFAELEGAGWGGRTWGLVLDLEVGKSDSPLKWRCRVHTALWMSLELQGPSGLHKEVLPPFYVLTDLLV